MARRGIGEGLISFAQNFIEGYKSGKTLENMAAERALKKKQFELDVERAGAGTAYLDPNTNTVKQIPGISPEAQGRLLQGVSNQPRTPGTGIFGKFVVGKKDKPTEEVTNVTPEEFAANPEKFRNTKLGKVVPTAKPIRTPEDMADLATIKLGMDSLAKNGSIPEALQPAVQASLSRIKPDLLTEEEQGVLYSLQQFLPGKTKEYKIKQAPQAAKSAKGSAGTMRVKDKKTGQTGTIPSSEFDPSLYDPL